MTTLFGNGKGGGEGTNGRVLGPYKTSVAPYCYCKCIPIIFTIVTHRSLVLLLLVIFVPLHYYFYIGFYYIVTP